MHNSCSKCGNAESNDAHTRHFFSIHPTFLTETRTDECKKTFLAYVNAWGVVNCESNLDSFIMGFRPGANFANGTAAATKHRLRI